MALGSLTELQNQLLVTWDLGYISKESVKISADKTILISKLINGLIKSSGALNT